MRWWWQKEEPDEKVEQEADPVKHKARQETEFIRTRLRLMQRVLREQERREQWTPPQ